jgi:hypothetical protein
MPDLASRGKPTPAFRRSSATWTWRLERPPSGVCDPNTSNLNVPVTHSHGLAVPRSEPAPDEIGKHTNGEPVIEQSRSGAASLPCRGKQFERATLAHVELTFFMQSAHRIALRRDPASAGPCRLLSGNVDALLMAGHKRSVPPKVPEKQFDPASTWAKQARRERTATMGEGCRAFFAPSCSVAREGGTGCASSALWARDASIPNRFTTDR